MRSLEFKEANKVLKKDAKSEDVHAFYGVIGNTKDHKGFVCCYELSEEEIENIMINKRIWLSQLTFNRPFNSIELFIKKNIFENNDQVYDLPVVEETFFIKEKTTFIQRLRNIFTDVRKINIIVKHVGYKSHIRSVYTK